jgi:hypothetical protein
MVIDTDKQPPGWLAVIIAVYSYKPVYETLEWRNHYGRKGLEETVTKGMILPTCHSHFPLPSPHAPIYAQFKSGRVRMRAAKRPPFAGRIFGSHADRLRYTRNGPQEPDHPTLQIPPLHRLLRTLSMKGFCVSSVFFAHDRFPSGIIAWPSRRIGQR